MGPGPIWAQGPMGLGLRAQWAQGLYMEAAAAVDMAAAAATPKKVFCASGQTKKK